MSEGITIKPNLGKAIREIVLMSAVFASMLFMNLHFFWDRNIGAMIAWGLCGTTGIALLTLLGRFAKVIFTGGFISINDNGLHFGSRFPRREQSIPFSDLVWGCDSPPLLGRTPFSQPLDTLSDGVFVVHSQNPDLRLMLDNALVDKKRLLAEFEKRGVSVPVAFLLGERLGKRIGAWPIFRPRFVAGGTGCQEADVRLPDTGDGLGMRVAIELLANGISVTNLSPETIISLTGTLRARNLGKGENGLAKDGLIYVGKLMMKVVNYA